MQTKTWTDSKHPSNHSSLSFCWSAWPKTMLAFTRPWHYLVDTLNLPARASGRTASCAAAGSVNACALRLRPPNSSHPLGAEKQAQRNLVPHQLPHRTKESILFLQCWAHDELWRGCRGEISGFRSHYSFPLYGEGDFYCPFFPLSLKLSNCSGILKLPLWAWAEQSL